MTESSHNFVKFSVIKPNCQKQSGFFYASGKNAMYPIGVVMHSYIIFNREKRKYKCIIASHLAQLDFDDLQFLVTMLLYNYLCPYVCPFVRMSYLGKNTIFSAPN